MSNLTPYSGGNSLVPGGGLTSSDIEIPALDMLLKSNQLGHEILDFAASATLDGHVDNFLSDLEQFDRDMQQLDDDTDDLLNDTEQGLGDL